MDAVQRTYGLRITGLTKNPQHHMPPDFFASCQGSQFSIEVTELFDGELNREIAAAKGAGKAMSGAEIFDRMQWTTGRLQGLLETRLTDKNDSYAKRGLIFDSLVIYTSENWLRHAEIERLLEGVIFQPRLCLKNAFILAPYQPDPSGDGNGYRPLHRLYGQFGLQRLAV